MKLYADASGANMMGTHFEYETSFTDFILISEVRVLNIYTDVTLQLLPSGIKVGDTHRIRWSSKTNKIKREVFISNFWKATNASIYSWAFVPTIIENYYYAVRNEALI